MADQPELAALRSSYRAGTLDEADLVDGWLPQLRRWLDDAVAAQLPDPNAMVLATVDVDGRPSSRTVLLKGLDARGLVLFTSYDSVKGRALAVNPQVAITFVWLPLQRQVQVHGTASRVDHAETESYFHSRPRGSQLGAWASRQSQVVTGRDVLEQALTEADRRYPDQVPVPPQWGGVRVLPSEVEFWQGRENRLHDRLRYRRDGVAWVLERLAP